MCVCVCVCVFIEVQSVWEWVGGHHNSWLTADILNGGELLISANFPIMKLNYCLQGHPPYTHSPKNMSHKDPHTYTHNTYKAHTQMHWSLHSYMQTQTQREPCMNYHIALIGFRRVSHEWASLWLKYARIKLIALIPRCCKYAIRMQTSECRTRGIINTLQQKGTAPQDVSQREVYIYIIRKMDI